VASLITIRKILLVLAAGLSVACACGQRRFRVMTYNVENLFDTVHDAGKADLEFLPEAERRWDSRRYWKKLGRLCSVIAAAGGESPVDLVALCEVENDSVLTHLLRRTLLRRLDYGYAMTCGPDPRGIDVALLYQPARFLPVEVRFVPIPSATDRSKPLRDLLHVAGRLPTGDTLDVFVCHFPSRAGGTFETEPARMRAAAVLRAQADSLLARRGTARLLLMGDFNEEISGKALRDVLKVKIPPEGAFIPETHILYDISENAQAARGIRGTYKYRGEWERLDHILVSGILLHPHARFHTGPETCRIPDLPFLVEEDETNGGVRPRRTYGGPFYRGGCSDHLPLTADFFY